SGEGNTVLVSDVGQRERVAQDRVVGLFRDQLGYAYLGNWRSRPGNANIEVELLAANLRARGYDERLLVRALEQLHRAAAVGSGRDLYEANRNVYKLLRYGSRFGLGLMSRSRRCGWWTGITPRLMISRWLRKLPWWVRLRSVRMWWCISMG